MSGNDVKGSKRHDAQQNVPPGAGSARVVARGSEAGADAEVRWVGQQQLMHGYCGRAVPAATPAAPETPHRRPRDLVVRVGPRRPAENAGSLVKAA